MQNIGNSVFYTDTTNEKSVSMSNSSVTNEMARGTTGTFKSCSMLLCSAKQMSLRILNVLHCIVFKKKKMQS